MLSAARFLFICLTALLVFSSLARAEEGDDDEGSLDGDFELLDLDQMLDTVISAAKHEQDITVAPSAITVISREQIENTHCLDLICLLRQVPELDVLRIKPMYAAVGARALTDEGADKVLVLIDGLEVNNEVFGPVFWMALPVHLSDIERVEVIRGPGSALYGANAHSAVVSITTRRLGDGNAELFLSGGEQGRISLAARAGANVDAWSFLLMASADKASHWRDPELDERDVNRLRLRIDRTSEGHQTQLQLGLTQASGAIYSILGPASFSDARFIDALIAHQAEHFKLQASFVLQKAVIPLGTDDDAETERIHIQGIVLGHVPAQIPFLNTNLDLQGQYNGSFFDGNVFIAGGNYRWIGNFSDAMNPGTIHQHRLGLFAQFEQELFGQLFGTLGARLDYNTLTPLTFSPRAAVLWRFATAQSLRFSFGQAFRKPSLLNTSLHIKGARAEPAFPAFETFFDDAVGNPDLNNESVTTLELGYRGRFFDDVLSAEAVMFYNRYRDTIQLYIDVPINEYGLPSLSQAVVQYQNAGREVDSLGGSLSLSWRMQRRVLVGANYSYRYSWYTSEPFGIAVAETKEKNDRVEWEPAHRINFFGHYLFDFGLRMGLSWHGVSAHTGYYSSGGVFDQRLAVEVPQNHMFGAFISFKAERERASFEVGARVFDLFNNPYRDLAGESTISSGALGGELMGRRVVVFVRGAY